MSFNKSEKKTTGNIKHVRGRQQKPGLSVVCEKKTPGPCPPAPFRGCLEGSGHGAVCVLGLHRQTELVSKACHCPAVPWAGQSHLQHGAQFWASDFHREFGELQSACWGSQELGVLGKTLPAINSGVSGSQVTRE